MKLDYCTIKTLTEIYGDAFYYLDIIQFERNYDNLLSSFRKYYKNTHIAYSYKTNYIPDLCEIIDSKGGFAEIVSDMEYRLAKSLNVKDSNIYYNGPYKSQSSIEDLLMNGGYLNIDSIYELDIIESIAFHNPNKVLHVGIRVNIEINDDVLSRFGFDVTDPKFIEVINRIQKISNVMLVGVHLHVATRSIHTWKDRVEKMIKIIESFFELSQLNYVSLGGGLYGNMHESLKIQFSEPIPSFHDYAKTVAIEFNNFAVNHGVQDHLKLIIEPGSALAGDSMNFITKVINVKKIRGKNIATVAGSIYNINPTLNKKNPPIQIIRKDSNHTFYLENVDIGGFTCIESDYLYRGYNGQISQNDFVVFSNVGSYSVVLKPPFILPNFGIIKYQNDKFIEVKKPETFYDVFHTYCRFTK